MASNSYVYDNFLVLHYCGHALLILCSTYGRDGALHPPSRASMTAKLIACGAYAATILYDGTRYMLTEMAWSKEDLVCALTTPLMYACAVYYGIYAFWRQHEFRAMFADMQIVEDALRGDSATGRRRDRRPIDRFLLLVQSIFLGTVVLTPFFVGVFFAVPPLKLVIMPALLGEFVLVSVFYLLAMTLWAADRVQILNDVVVQFAAVDVVPIGRCEWCSATRPPTTRGDFCGRHQVKYVAAMYALSLRFVKRLMANNDAYLCPILFMSLVQAPFLMLVMLYSLIGEYVAGTHKIVAAWFLISYGFMLTFLFGSAGELLNAQLLQIGRNFHKLYARHWDLRASIAVNSIYMLTEKPELALVSMFPYNNRMFLATLNGAVLFCFAVMQCAI